MRGTTSHSTDPRGDADLGATTSCLARSSVETKLGMSPVSRSSFLVAKRYSEPCSVWDDTIAMLITIKPVWCFCKLENVQEA